MRDVPAARNVLRVLRFLSSQPGPVRASAIYRFLGIPRSSAFHLIGVMMDEGFLVHYPETYSYGLSKVAAEVGSSYYRSYQLERQARPLMAKLLAKSGPAVTAHLTVLHGREVLYLLKEARAGAPRTITAVGVRLPAHTTASGRALLAGLPDSQVAALYPETVVVPTVPTANGRTAVDGRELRRRIELVRQRGWAGEVEEVDAGMRSVAAAALDHNGLPAAAFSLAFATPAHDEDEVEAEYAHQVQVHANALSMRLRGKI